MGLLSFLSYKKQRVIFVEKSLKPERDYNCLIDMAKIITNNNQKAVAEIEKLVLDYDSFYDKYKNYCDDILDCADDESEHMLLIFAYFLAGYDTDYKFGAYIDWKEEPKEILLHLKKAIKNLAYRLSLNKIKLDGNLRTPDALKVISDYLFKKNYQLVTLDTDSDCYHLFLIKAEDFAILESFEPKTGFRFIKFS